MKVICTAYLYLKFCFILNWNKKIGRKVALKMLVKFNTGRSRRRRRLPFKQWLSWCPKRRMKWLAKQWNLVTCSSNYQFALAQLYKLTHSFACFCSVLIAFALLLSRSFARLCAVLLAITQFHVLTRIFEYYCIFWAFSKKHKLCKITIFYKKFINYLLEVEHPSNVLLSNVLLSKALQSNILNSKYLNRVSYKFRYFVMYSETQIIANVVITNVVITKIFVCQINNRLSWMTKVGH